MHGNGRTEQRKHMLLYEALNPIDPMTGRPTRVTLMTRSGASQLAVVSERPYSPAVEGMSARSS